MDRADEAERGARFPPPPPPPPPPPTSEYRAYNPRDYAPASPAAATMGAAVANEYSNPYDRQASSARPDYGFASQPISTTAAKYTPGAGYAPSPVNAPTSLPDPGYAPYNPADYASSAGDRAPGDTYLRPPSFHRQQSQSQPPLDRSPYPDGQDQLAAFDPPPIRHGSSTSSHHHRHGDGKHHRARSAGHHGRSRSQVTDQIRGRFENMDLHDKNLAASVGGALAGGWAGKAVGHGTLSTLIGAGIGAIGGRELEKRHERKKTTRERSRSERSRSRHSGSRRSYSQSPLRDRRRGDRYDDNSYSDSESDGHRRFARRRRGRRNSGD